MKNPCPVTQKSNAFAIYAILFLPYLTNIISALCTKKQNSAPCCFPGGSRKQRPFKQIWFHNWLSIPRWHTAGVQVNLTRCPLTQWNYCKSKGTMFRLSHLKEIISTSLYVSVFRFASAVAFCRGDSYYVWVGWMLAVMLKWMSCATSWATLPLHVARFKQWNIIAFLLFY